MTRTRRRSPRGTSLIEAMIAIAVLLIGMAGFASLQVISVRANHFAKRISAASALATDLAENVNRWDYLDPRLTPGGSRADVTATGCTTAAIQTCLDAAVALTPWDLGTAATPAYTPDYNDASLMGAGGWQGIPVVTGGVPTTFGADTDRDGVPEFFRYYNVHQLYPTGTDLFPTGKLVQIVVRWKEPAFGYRQVTTTAFKYNPRVVSQTQ